MRFNPFKQLYDYMIPVSMMRSRDISFTAKCAYSVLRGFAGENGRCFPSEKAIAECMGVTERYARTLVAELADAGYIEFDRGNGHRANQYYFIREKVAGSLRTATTNIPTDASAANPEQLITKPGTVIPPNRINELAHEEKPDVDPLPANRNNPSDSQAAFAPAVRNIMAEELGHDPGLNAVDAVMVKAGNNEKLALEAIRLGLGKIHRKGDTVRSVCWFVSTVANYITESNYYALPPSTPLRYTPDDMRVPDFMEVAA